MYVEKLNKTQKLQLRLIQCIHGYCLFKWKQISLQQKKDYNVIVSKSFTHLCNTGTALMCQKPGFLPVWGLSKAFTQDTTTALAVRCYFVYISGYECMLPHPGSHIQ